MGIPANSADSVDFSTLIRPVTYQIRTPDGWINVSRAIYATIKNQQNRRILLRDEKKIINSELITHAI
jgi:hypothetical protein